MPQEQDLYASVYVRGTSLKTKLFPDSDMFLSAYMKYTSRSKENAYNSSGKT